jgi:TonB family protein
MTPLAARLIEERPRPPPPALRPANPPLVVAPSLDRRRSPDPRDFYPAAARRAEREGVAVVETCIDVSGRATNPGIQRSAGSEDLDAAALRWAQRARWGAGTRDGVPVETCGVRFQVRFALQE